jgi:hypothetical protein
MNKPVCLIACLLALSICHASFQRPWQNHTWLSNNPYISVYGIELWFGLPDLHGTITSIRNDSLDSLKMNGSASRYAANAQHSIGLAKRDLDQCIERLSIASIGFPVSPFGSAAETFFGIYYCTRYPSDWKGSVDSILKAVEESVKAADSAVSRARSSYEIIRFAGLCDENYTYGGSENCPVFQAAFSSVDGKIKEGEFGKYAILMDYSSSLERELDSYAPDLQSTSKMMGLVWTEGGIIDTFDSLLALSNQSKAAAEYGFFFHYQSAFSKRAQAIAKLAELHGQHLEMVDQAPAASGMLQPGPISERLSSSVGVLNGLSAELDSSRESHGRVTQKGYLAASVILAADSDESYSSFLEDLDSILGDAKETLTQQREEAEAEISKTENHFRSTPPSTEASTLFNEAKRVSASASGLGSIGAKFAAYAHAAALARSARSARSYQDEAEIKASLAGLESLIAAAEKDRVNVDSEKASLELLKGAQESDIRPYVKICIASIVSKASAKYEEELALARMRIYDKLSLGGVEVESIGDELEGYQEGFVIGGTTLYPEAIGHLSVLKRGYEAIEGELDAHMSKIVGNSMGLSASPAFGPVRLDEPCEMSLDLVMPNNRNYSAARAEVPIHLEPPAEFLFSDIVSGQARVESIRSQDGGKTMVLALMDIKPSETVRVILKKKTIIAHTLRTQVKATGLGGDAAHISSTIDFELESGINKLALPEGDILIDGSAPGHPLAQGKHTLSIEDIMDDAYSETIGGIRASISGMNSRVEYQITITPKINLDSVPILIDSINDSRMTGFNAICGSGEPIEGKKQISETQYSLSLKNLKKGKSAVVSVSYTVEHLDSFVNSQISILDNAGLSSSARSFLESAKSSAGAGDFQSAIVFIEKAKAAQKEADVSDAKQQKKYDDLSSKVQAEDEEISSALSKLKNQGDSINSTFLDTLGMRKDELEAALNQSIESDLSEKVTALSKIDSNWLDDEIGSLKKNVSKQYNDLKERFFKAGNASTPDEFLKFEESFNRLEAGGKLEYGLDALSKIEDVKAIVLKQEAKNSSGTETLIGVFRNLKDAISNTLDLYQKESSAAKGTEFSGYFSENANTVAKALADAESFSSSDQKRFSLKIDELNKSDSKMRNILSSLKKEAEAQLTILEGVFAQKDLDEAKKKEMGAKIDAMRGMVASAQYVNSLRAGISISKELDSLKPANGNGLVVLGLTALAVLGGVGFYMIKQKPPPKLRKLASIPDPPFNEADQKSLE